MACERVTPCMTAFVTLAPVYSTPVRLSDFGIKRSREQDLMTSRALEQFLASVEKRAFKIAQLGLRNNDDALDAVQDAMMKLVQSYGTRGIEEWRPLFYRILANRIRDMQRRRTVRGRIMAWLPLRDAEDDEDFDPIAQAPSPELNPVRRLELLPGPSARLKRLCRICRRASSRPSCCEILKASTSARRPAPWAVRKAA